MLGELHDLDVLLRCAQSAAPASRRRRPRRRSPRVAGDETTPRVHANTVGDAAGCTRGSSRGSASLAAPADRALDNRGVAPARGGRRGTGVRGARRGRRSRSGCLTRSLYLDASRHRAPNAVTNGPTTRAAAHRARARRACAQARGPRRLDVRFDEILTSPLVRARQTAEILATPSRAAPRSSRLPALAPGRSPKRRRARRCATSRARTSLALVGHEPARRARRLADRPRGSLEFKNSVPSRSRRPLELDELRWR